MYNYDTIPYESLPFAETHPQRLALLGRLFGIHTADPANCRLLELGSATGGNIIPMAWYNPTCEFVGLELEAIQVEIGCKIIESAGLKNVQLLQGDIAQAGEKLGQFDYIIAHGVYSWIPEPVRIALLKLYKKCLKPGGIAYISFNTRPGWHTRSMIRDMLLYHLRDVTNPVDRLNSAFLFIDTMISTQSQLDTAQSRHLLEEFRYLQTSHPGYVFHEFLEDYNEAYFFNEFASALNQHGLRYLCESQLGSMFASRYGDRAEELIDQLCDPVEQELYLDYFSQRTLRQSILCHDNITPDYDIDLAQLESLACNSSLKPPAKIDLREDHPQAFISPAGKQYSVTDPVCKLILKNIYNSYPDAIALKQAQADAEQEYRSKTITSTPAGSTDWQTEIFSLFASDALQLVVKDIRLNKTISETPVAHDLARAQLAAGQNPVSCWHETVELDAFARQLLVYLDGSRNLAMLVEQMCSDLLNGRLVIDGLNSSTKNKQQQKVEANIKRLLSLFADTGLLRTG